MGAPHHHADQQAQRHYRAIGVKPERTPHSDPQRLSPKTATPTLNIFAHPGEPQTRSTLLIKVDVSEDTLHVEFNDLVLPPVDSKFEEMALAELHPVRGFLRLACDTYTEAPWDVWRRWTRTSQACTRVHRRQ